MMVGNSVKYGPVTQADTLKRKVYTFAQKINPHPLGQQQC